MLRSLSCAGFFVLCGFFVVCGGPTGAQTLKKSGPEGWGPRRVRLGSRTVMETPAVQNSTALVGSGASNTTKIPRKTPRERQKERKWGRERKKKVQNFGRSRVEWPNAGGVRRRGRTGGSKTNNHTTPTPNTNTQQQHTTTTHEQQHTNKNTQTTYNHNNTRPHITMDWSKKKKKDWPKLAGQMRWPKMDWPKMDWPKNGLNVFCLVWVFKQ